MDVRKFQVVLIAKDFDRTLAFYRDVLGLAISHSWDRPDGRGVYFHFGGGFIEVLDERSAEHVEKVEGGAKVPLVAIPARIGVQVDDIEGLYQRLGSRGIPLQMALVDAPWGHRVFRVADPDGMVLTFYAEHKL